jgi:hypothetical protein
VEAKAPVGMFVHTPECKYLPQPPFGVIPGEPRIARRGKGTQAPETYEVLSEASPLIPGSSEM